MSEEDKENNSIDYNALVNDIADSYMEIDKREDKYYYIISRSNVSYYS